MAQIELIDEKLAELKTKKVLPDCDGLLSRFEWTRDWFIQIEEVLLTLAYRGECDQIILDFIRAKIRETDILTFNDILQQFGELPICNHYQLILNHKGNEGYEDNIIYKNNNKSIQDYIFKKNIRTININNRKFLSQCCGDVVVDYLISNPHLISWGEFRQNINPKVIKYCISNGKEDAYMTAKNNADEIVDIILTDIDKYMLYCGESIYRNTNDRIVEHILTNPNKIYMHMLCENSNDKVIDYILANPENINYAHLSCNPNDRAVAHLLANPDKIDYSLFSANTNDRAVAHLLANPEKIDWVIFYSNSNDYAVEHILHTLGFSSIFNIFKNTCNYNMQKVRAFNKLGLFPRLPHLRI